MLGWRSISTLILVGVFFSFACKDKSEVASEKSQTPRIDQILSISDFRVQAQALSQNPIEDAIDNTYQFLAKKSGDFNSIETCIGDLKKGVKAKVFENYVLVDEQIDGSCLVEMSNRKTKVEKSVKVSGKVRLYLHVTTKDCSLKGMDDDLVDLDLPYFFKTCGTGELEIYSAIEGTLQADIKNAKESGLESVSIKTGLMDSSSESCRFTVENTSANFMEDCHDIALTELVLNQPESKITTYQDLNKKKGLKTSSNSNDDYYTSGNIDFIIDDWNGTMTYKSGTSAPSWSARSASGNASGVYRQKITKVNLLNNTGHL